MRLRTAAAGGAVALFTLLALVWSTGDQFRALASLRTPSPLTLTQQLCDPNHLGQVEAVFGWTPAGGSQWMDVSIFDNGFAPGTFIGIGPINPLYNNNRIHAMRPNTTHFVRVNSLTEDGWVLTETLAFATMNCAPPATPPTALTYTLYGPIRYGCSEYDMGTDTYSWEPLGAHTAAGPQGLQWLDVSLVNNGFVPGTFVSVGPIPANRGYAVAPSLGYRSTPAYWRVNTLTSRGWVPSQTLSATFPILPMHNGCN